MSGLLILPSLVYAMAVPALHTTCQGREPCRVRTVILGDTTAPREDNGCSLPGLQHAH